MGEPKVPRREIKVNDYVNERTWILERNEQGWWLKRRVYAGYKQTGD